MSTLKQALLVGLAILGMLLMVPAHARAGADPDTGYLLVTPDRGFLGNAEIGDAFDAFASRHKAAIVYVTDARSQAIVEQRVSHLRQQGATRIVVLPLVLSPHDPRWQQAQDWIRALPQQASIHTAMPYGESYLAVEDLSARLRAVHGDFKRILLVGYGADSSQDAARMAMHLRHMAGFASTLDAEHIDAVIWPQRKAAKYAGMEKAVKNTLAKAQDTLVLPLAFAPRDDSMMAFSNWLKRDLGKGSMVVDSPMASSAHFTQWMQRAANQANLHEDRLDPAKVGVIALAHGSDWFWNRTIRQSLSPVAGKHPLAFAFSMADPPVVERAVRELEGKHVQAIVLVRVFGKSSSFMPSIRRMLGMDVEAMQHGKHHGHGGHGGKHGMGMMMQHHGASLAAAPRIRSALPIVTVGGVDTDPLFARALLANARSVSREPARETVIVVAHGNGQLAANQVWLDMLDKLAAQMRADGGSDFRAIRVATWQEDWPEQRKISVAKVRKMVEQADRDGGRALIVPARINGRGAADRYLKGLDFGWGQGFAQTPYLAQWFEQQVQIGMKALQAPARPAMHAFPESMPTH